MKTLVLLILLTLQSSYFLIEDDLYYKLSDVQDFKVIKTDEENCLWTLEGDSYLVDGITCSNWIRRYENGELVYENDFSIVNPWLIDAGDLDGDGIFEVVVGTYNKAPFYPIDKRVFVFDWTGEYLTKKWTGSYLSFNQLIDFRVDDIDGNGIYEIISNERDKSDNEFSFVYRWVDFGFTQETYKD